MRYFLLAFLTFLLVAATLHPRFFSSPLYAASLSINATDGGITIEGVGPLETVYDYSAQRCNETDVPDLPARAFRDADGAINLHAAHTLNYRSVGKSFDSLRRSCTSIYSSKNKKDFNALTYHEWLSAPYTPDGKNVYSLVHNEWYANLVDPRCVKSSVIGWINSVTLVASQNGGKTFSRPADYIVRRPAKEWSTSFPCSAPGPTTNTVYGSFSPSNIIKKGEYYYSVVHEIKGPWNSGTCLMRTADLSRGSAWEIFTANDWQKANTKTECAFLQNVNVMHESLTYNTYLGKYVLLGTLFHPTPDFAIALSDDLIHWSKPIRILRLPELHRPYQYPSLIDHTSPSRNFETTDREAYLYFTFHHGAPNYSDRDLMRQKIRFTQTADATPPTVEIVVPTKERAYETDKSSITLSALVTDTSDITAVTWKNKANNKEGPAQLSYGWVALNVPLAAGDNEIIYSAHDRAGNTGVDTVTIRYRSPALSSSPVRSSLPPLHTAPPTDSPLPTTSLVVPAPTDSPDSPALRNQPFQLAIFVVIALIVIAATIYAIRYLFP